MILAIDPGLDGTGWALFNPPAQHLATLQGYAPCLVASGAVTTDPDDRPDHIQIPARVDVLVAGVRNAVGAHTSHIDIVIIEVPAAFGPYAARGADRQMKALSMARSMACLWYAIGRLEGCWSHPLTTLVHLKATGTKADNHDRARLMWPALPKNLTGPKADQTDAVCLGLRYLLDRRRVAA